LAGESARVRRTVKALELQLEEIERRKRNLIDAVASGVFKAGDIREQVEGLERERLSIQERVKALQYEVDLSDDALQFLYEQSRELKVDEFRIAEPSERRDIYITLLESARLFADKLIIRFRNQKTFVLDVQPNVGRRRHTVFQMRVMFYGRPQHSLLINVQDNVLTPIPVSPIDAFRSRRNEHYQRVCERVTVLLQTTTEYENIKSLK
jgi:hypothetical protein